MEYANYLNYNAYQNAINDFEFNSNIGAKNNSTNFVMLVTIQDYVGCGNFTATISWRDILLPGQSQSWSSITNTAYALCSNPSFSDPQVTVSDVYAQ